MICRFLQFLKRYGIIQHKSEKNSACLKPVKGIGMEPLGGSCMVQFQKDAALGGIPFGVLEVVYPDKPLRRLFPVFQEIQKDVPGHDAA